MLSCTSCLQAIRILTLEPERLKKSSTTPPNKSHRRWKGSFPRRGLRVQFIDVRGNAYAGLAVIDRLQIMEAQSLGEFASIDFVTFIARAILRGLHTRTSVTCGLSRS